MKRRIVLLCLLILGLLSACGGTAEAPPGADTSGGASLEDRTFVLDDLTLTLPETVQDPRWTGPRERVVQAEFRWGGDSYVYRVKKSRRADNLSDIPETPYDGPEGGEPAANATRCVVDDGSKGFIAWNVRDHAFTLSMEASASDRKLLALYRLLLDELLSDCSQPPSLQVRCGDRDVPAVRTVCAWKRRKNLGDGGKSLVVTDGIHPLQMLDEEGRVSLTPLPVPPGAEIELDFALTPEELTVRCWTEEAARAVFEDPDLLAAYEEQALELTVTEGRAAPPGPGNYIYEVRARWSDDSGYGGTAGYGFYTVGS